MKKLLRKCLFFISVIVVSIVLYMFLLDELIMPYLVDVPRVRVPRLRGMSAVQAERNLAKWNIFLAIGDSLYHETLPAGAVVGQDPSPGEQIKKGRRITVDISLGPQFYPVPDSIAGVSLREARLQLEASQLMLGEINHVSSENIPEGAVIRATPPSGTPLPRDTLVDLEISNGSPQLPKRVPQLLDLPIEQVEDTLRKYEMRLGPITSRVAPAHPIGTVLDQSPGPRELALRMTPIELVVSARETTATQADTTVPTHLLRGETRP